MLYHLLYPLQDSVPAFNVFRYITFRSAGAALTALLLCLLLGPWAHSSIEDSDPGPNIDIVAEHLRWWDRWLKGIDNGIDREPEIVLFARRSTRPSPTLKEYRGEWRYERTWPVDRLVGSPFELEKATVPPSQGTGPDELAVRGDVGWTAWISCAGGWMP